MNKHTRMSIRSGQAHANQRARAYWQDQAIKAGRRKTDMPIQRRELASFRQCQFIAGEDHYMCGAEALPGKPHCATHYALTHRPYDGGDAA